MDRNDRDKHKEANRKYEEVTVATESKFKGKVIHVDVETVRLPNGGTALREIVRHQGAVCVLALKDDKMLVVEQYRKPLGRSQVEIPAGKLEPGEDPLEAAGRELEEETGYRCRSMKPVSAYYTSPGFCDEYIYFYLAEELEEGNANPDEDEFLDVEEISLEQAKRYIEEGRISDAKTILAVYAWELYKLTGRI